LSAQIKKTVSIVTKEKKHHFLDPVEKPCKLTTYNLAFAQVYAAIFKSGSCNMLCYIISV